MGLGWWHGEDEFGPYVYHAGSVNVGEALMRVYPEQDVGVVVMGRRRRVREVSER